ncbi:hypothetical protein AOQ84DRAFT_364379 [Glonium stellatum]|uniref:Uncharacterized protein n=1 Tax=Glonium stellatum TaxID=574774 RepID=A0A8E2F051_9PEZI|nr:hypothetical protein AOQ84DRAFT_364379 [Glonium stellatum]
MAFPKYPSSLDLIKEFLNAKAFNARNIDPCYDDYSFGEGKKAINVDGCKYFAEWWGRCNDVLNTQINAINYLIDEILEVSSTCEMVLLPGRLNVRGQRLFSSNNMALSADNKWVNYEFNRKVNELREWLMVVQYLNEAEIQRYFLAVSTRIRGRLLNMEGGSSTLFMSNINDFYWKWTNPAKREDYQKDLPNERYRSFGLSSKWARFIYNFLEGRLDKLEAFLDSEIRELERNNQAPAQ